MIPDMTTGINDHDHHDMSMGISNGKWKATFITSSGNEPKRDTDASLTNANSSSTHNHMVDAGDLILTAEYHLFQSK